MTGSSATFSFLLMFCIDLPYNDLQRQYFPSLERQRMQAAQQAALTRVATAVQPGFESAFPEPWPPYHTQCHPQEGTSSALKKKKKNQTNSRISTAKTGLCHASHPVRSGIQDHKLVYSCQKKQNIPLATLFSKWFLLLNVSQCIKFCLFVTRSILSHFISVAKVLVTQDLCQRLWWRM